MASLTTAIKTLLAVFFSVLIAQNAPAATFSAKRGLNMDIWQTWPGAETWHDESVLVPFPEWQKSVGKADLEELREAGFDFLRIPVDPAPFLANQTRPFRDRLYASVIDAVQLVNEAGLKAVIDLHTYPQGTGDRVGTEEIQSNSALFESYLEIVRRMGRELSVFEPGQVAFELMNEPTLGCENRSAWEELQYRLYAAARSSATRHTLVLSGGCWSGADDLAQIDPGNFADDNIIWTFHSYAPFILTHQGATWTGGFISEVTGLPYPLGAVSSEGLGKRLDAIGDRIDASDRADIPAGTRDYFERLIAEINTPEKLATEIAKPFEQVANWAKHHGIEPVDIFLGEFGMIRQEYGNKAVTPARYRSAYYKDVIEIAERFGFSWAAWGYGGAFGIVEEFDGRRAEPDVLDMIRTLPRE